MSYQSTLETAVELARVHELEINGLGTQPQIKELNGITECIGRQILLSSDEVIELELNSEGKLEKKRTFTESNALIFGKFSGFTEIEVLYNNESSVEIGRRTSLGLLLKKDHEKIKYSFCPIGSTKECFDVIESLPDDEITADVCEELSNKTIDLFRLALQVRQLKSDAKVVASLKAYLHSTVLPIEICQSVVAPRFFINDGNLTQFEPTTQYVDSEYRLSLIVDTDGNFPTLCFENDSDDGKQSSLLILEPSKFTGYTKPV